MCKKICKNCRFRGFRYPQEPCYSCDFIKKNNFVTNYEQCAESLIQHEVDKLMKKIYSH